MITLGEEFIYLFIFSFTSRAYFEIDHGSNSFRPSSPIEEALLESYEDHTITHFKLGLSPQFKYVSFMCQHHINGPHVLHN